MDISVVDRSAVLGRSALHRVDARTKLAGTALVLVAVIVSTNWLVVVSVALALSAAAVGARLPLRPLFALAAYPTVFAALFAFASGVTGFSAALIITKATTSALSVLLLIFTTPYPQVFAPIQRRLPEIIADSLLMTYRSLFLLLDRFGHTLTAARLRAGLVGARPLRSVTTVTRSLGAVLLYSIDLSQRTHDIMRLRGYDGRLIVTLSRSESKLIDAGVLGVAATIAAGAIGWRVWWPILNPYAWAPAIAALVALGLSAAYTWSRKASS